MTDPTKCPECKGPMKPLFSGYYCPQDCDRPEVLAARKAKAEEEAAKANTYVLDSGPYKGWHVVTNWPTANGKFFIP